MKSTSLLQEDHAVIKKVLGALNRVADGEEVPVATLRDAVAFSQTFVDRCHHGKEEVCLFPCLEARGVPKEGGPIGMMLMEHEMGRRLARAIDETLKRYEESAADRAEVMKRVREYVELLEQHIWKEGNVLFAMASQVMHGTDDDETVGCYEVTEAERVGEETHHRMLDLAEKIGKRSGT